MGSKIEEPESAYQNIDVGLIDHSPANRSLDSDDAGIKELAESIASQGLLSPIAVRPGKGGRYEVIFGHRRLAAVKRLERAVVPAFVVQAGDAAAQAMRLIENLQRRDLTPMEEAAGVAALLDMTGGDVSEAAARLGRSETWVRRRNRLNNLSPAWREVLFNPEHEDYDNYRHLAGSMEMLEELALLPVAEQDDLLTHNQLMYVADARALREVLAGKLMRLDKAPWDKNFTCGERGRCSACRNRSDSEGDLFAILADSAQEEDEKKEPVFCLEADCWREKTAAWIRQQLAENPDLLPIALRWGAGRVDNPKALAAELGVARLVMDWSPAGDGADGDMPEGHEIRQGIYCAGPETGKIIRIAVNKGDLTEKPEKSPASAGNEQKIWREKMKKEEACERRVAGEKIFRRALSNRIPAERPVGMSDGHLLLLVRAFGYHGHHEKIPPADGTSIKEAGSYLWSHYRKELSPDRHIYDATSNDERKALCKFYGADWNEISAEMAAANKTDKTKEKKGGGGKEKKKTKKKRSAGAEGTPDDGADDEPEEKADA